jgi:hypothetical protein
MPRIRNNSTTTDRISLPTAPGRTVWSFASDTTTANGTFSIAANQTVQNQVSYAPLPVQHIVHDARVPVALGDLLATDEARRFRQSQLDEDTAYLYETLLRWQPRSRQYRDAYFAMVAARNTADDFRQSWDPNGTSGHVLQDSHGNRISFTREEYYAPNARPAEPMVVPPPFEPPLDRARRDQTGSDVRRAAPPLTSVQMSLTPGQEQYLSDIIDRPEYLPETRFGVEIEYVGLTRQRAYEVLSQAGIPSAIEEYNHARRAHWKLTTDSSIRVSRGMSGDMAGELVSPPLSGLQGLRQVMLVCRVMSEAGAKVNGSCGLHVHVDGSTLNAQDVTQILMRYSANQEFVDWFMPRNRRNNRYCMPVASAVGDLDGWLNNLWQEETPVMEVARRWNRYSTVNLASWTRHGTLEFRQHAGSIGPEVVANWIQFCLYFVNTSRFVMDPSLLTAARPPVVEQIAQVLLPTRRVVTPTMVNGIRLNRRLRYDRRRGLFAVLIERSRRGETVTERELARHLRTTRPVISRMIAELNNIALGPSPRTVQGANGANYWQRPANGFFISTRPVGRNARRDNGYAFASLSDLITGDYHHNSHETYCVRGRSIGLAGIDATTYYYPEGVVGPVATQGVYQSLLQWLGGICVSPGRFLVLDPNWQDHESERQRATRTEAHRLWNEDWAVSYSNAWRRHPRVPPVNADMPPATIPARRRSPRAQYPRPTMQSFTGIDPLFRNMPVPVREFYLARATRNRAPWLTPPPPAPTPQEPAGLTEIALLPPSSISDTWANATISVGSMAGFIGNVASLYRSNS